MVGVKLIWAGAAALALAGCQASNDRGVASVCAPFAAAAATATASAATTTPANAPATAAPLAAADPAGGLDDCLHRWAYALAPARDDASHVAEAVTAACQGTLGRWNQQTASSEGETGPPIEAPSLITGRPTSPIEQHLSFAQGRAVFYVVQARAGRCAAPPMKDGVPVGLTRD
jgi:hypothetical protein